MSEIPGPRSEAELRLADDISYDRRSKFDNKNAGRAAIILLATAGTRIIGFSAGSLAQEVGFSVAEEIGS